MRLIDADALKEEANKKKVVGRFNTIMLIDNAPTVKPEEAKEGEIVKAYTKGFDTGVEIARIERPQGEWKTTDAYPHKIYCGKCFKTYAQEDWEVWKDGSLPRNFCPNCGADMRDKEDVFTRKEELSKEESEWLIDFITKEDN